MTQKAINSILSGEIINRNMTAHDVCGLLALCWVLFEVWVTNVDTSSSFESSAAAVLSESRGPVAMAKGGGGGRGGGGGGRGGRSGGRSGGRGWIGGSGRGGSVSGSATPSSLNIHRVGQKIEFLSVF